MVKVVGPQTIPAEIAGIYHASLTALMANGAIRKRYPFRIPLRQGNGYKVTAAQKKQRASFKQSIDNIRLLTYDEKHAWYEAAATLPVTMGYRYYFTMSELKGNVNILQGGAGVIKSIQTIQMTIGTGTSEGSVAITEINSSKAVALINGWSYIVNVTPGSTYTLQVGAYITELSDTLVKAKWCLASRGGFDTDEATISIQVIEYI